MGNKREYIAGLCKSNCSMFVIPCEQRDQRAVPLDYIPDEGNPLADLVMSLRARVIPLQHNRNSFTFLAISCMYPTMNYRIGSTCNSITVRD